jgi:microcystin-dependent protein
MSGCSSDPYIGTVCQAGFNFCPRSYARTDGQLLSISSNNALFALVGTIYGGDGRTSFGLPDLRGRSIIGSGQGPGLSNVRIGQRAGSEQITLIVANMPAHTHTASASFTLRAFDGAGTTDQPAGAVLASQRRNRIYSTDPGSVSMGSTAVNTSGSFTVASTGGGQAFSTRSPSVGITHCIALFGIFPSRS